MGQTKNFGAVIDRTIRVIKANYLKAFKENGVDITAEQWVVLDFLYKNDGVSQTELANGSFKNAPTVSRIIDLLCKKGLTERRKEKEDRRRHQIFLTAAGKVTYEKALPAVLELRARGWKGLSDADYEDFLRIMDQVFRNFNEN